MSGLNYFLRRIDFDVLNRKFIVALNKCSERYNSIKENYPQNLTWFKNFVTATLIMSVERMIELETEEGSRKIQDSLIDYYSDEIEERWNELQEFGIRESITRILREESNKKNIRFKNTVKKYIDDYGISYTKKIFSMTTTDIIKILESPINSEIAYEILLENMSNGNLTTKYKEFTIYPQQWEGTVYWGAITKTGHFLPNISEEITAIATPFWDGNEWTPIDIDDVNLKDEDGRVIIRRGGAMSNYYRKLEHKSNFENVQELFTWYEEFYLPEVYNVVMNTLLPIVYQDIDDKLDERMSY